MSREIVAKMDEEPRADGQKEGCEEETGSGDMAFIDKQIAAQKERFTNDNRRRVERIDMWAIPVGNQLLVEKMLAGQSAGGIELVEEKDMTDQAVIRVLGHGPLCSIDYVEGARPLYPVDTLLLTTAMALKEFKVSRAENLAFVSEDDILGYFIVVPDDEIRSFIGNGVIPSSVERELATWRKE